MVKIGQAVSDDIYMIHVYSPGARANNPGGGVGVQNFNSVCYFDHTL